MDRPSTCFGQTLACIALVLLIGCDSEHAAPDAGAQIEDAENHTQVTDKHCDEALARENKGEAREWLKNANHVFFKGDRKKIAQFIEDFYSAGATQVYIVDTEKHDATVYGGALLVVLPKDAAVRTKIFAMDQAVAQAFDEDAVKDEGQKYLFHAFD